MTECFKYNMRAYLSVYECRKKMLFGVKMGATVDEKGFVLRLRWVLIHGIEAPGVVVRE